MILLPRNLAIGVFLKMCYKSFIILIRGTAMLKIVSFLGLSAVLTTAFATNLMAEDAPGAAVVATGPAIKACVQQASIETIPEELKADPAKFFAGFADGGGSLVRNVRSLLVADASQAKNLTKALSGLNDKQAFSVGVGMGQAAASCNKDNAPAAIAIQQAVAESGNAAALAGFSQAFGNLLVASTGGGGLGGLASGSSSAIGSGFDGGGGGTNVSDLGNASVSSPNKSGNFLTGSILGSTQQRTASLISPVSPGAP
jgi:hypothetical protein